MTQSTKQPAPPAQNGDLGMFKKLGVDPVEFLLTFFLASLLIGVAGLALWFAIWSVRGAILATGWF